MAVAREYGCEVPFRRPDVLAEDDTSSMDALLHALDQVETHDYVVLLQQTSPLRTADDINASIARCHETEAPACVTVTENDKPPLWMYTFGEGNKLEPVMDQDERITRQQEAPTIYVPNGAAYVAGAAWLREHETFYTDATIGHPMPPGRSVDVDTAMGLSWCEHLSSRNMLTDVT